ncbi:MAG: sensor histidine kinase [Pelagimonas sp.]|uniref:sensor histidine kinase n=1 Tax=Pelagimonas sp. TaxID=2073170 RepID=UPI003D6A6E19
MTANLSDFPTSSFSDAAWAEVVLAIEDTYSELATYQSRLEAQNVELEGLRRFMGSVLSSISDILFVVDKSRRIEEVNGSVQAILGSDDSVALGTPAETLFSKSDQALLRQTLDQVVLTKQSMRIEVEIMTTSGATPLDLSIAPRLDDRGRSRGAVLVGRPLGELRNAYAELEDSHNSLKEAQSYLVRSEKLASLGRLVAGVAHELNNPISFVYANTHALEKYTRRIESYFQAVESGAAREDLVKLRAELRLDRAVKNLRDALNGAKEGAERVRDIVEDLRRLSADGRGDAILFDLNTTARTAVDWVVRGTKTPTAISFVEESGLQAFGNPAHVQQIVMNLVQNALDALAQVPDPKVTIMTGAKGDRVMLRVTDNGTGIPNEVATSIFDPFYTTKPVGKGTGLGLAISHKIAEEHAGTLTLLTSEVGNTCFELTLPKSAPL